MPIKTLIYENTSEALNGRKISSYPALEMTNIPPLKMRKAKYKCAWQKNPLLRIANEVL